MNINKLINEAKKRYKVGDRFRVVHQPMDICTIESFDFHEDTIIISPEGNWHFNLLVTDSGGADSATVCKNGEWAEKVEPEKTPEQLAAELGFKIGDKLYDKANTGKFKVGDRVRLTRKCKSYEGDWDGIWAFADAYVGGNYTILSSDNQYGYQLDIKLWFPEFVLEKVVTKYLADEFQVMTIEPYVDEQPATLKGKLFDTLEEANAYHESVKPNTYTVELPKGYEVKREYVILGNIELIDGIFLKLKHI